MTTESTKELSEQTVPDIQALISEAFCMGQDGKTGVEVERIHNQAEAAINAHIEQVTNNCNAVPDDQPNDVHIRFFNTGYRKGKADAEREIVSVLESLKEQQVELVTNGSKTIPVRVIDAAIKQYKEQSS